MKILVTGSAGHLGEALVRTLEESGHEVTGVDITASTYTKHVGSIVDRAFVKGCMAGVEAVLHTATLHKPHVATHNRQEFIDTNVTGTLNLLEEAVSAGAGAFVFTSTTSAFGSALRPRPGDAAIWVTEELKPIPRNIYGVTKVAAEDLCALVHRDHALACIILRTARFFPEPDDQAEIRAEYEDANAKLNEYLYRRVDIEDVVSAHLRAVERAPALGFGRYIISATTPFKPEDLDDLRRDASKVVSRRVPGYERVYAQRGWKMFASIDRVYDNARARRDLGWQPRYNFQSLLAQVEAGEDLRSPLARLIGSKGYHGGKFGDGLYPVIDKE